MKKILFLLVAFVATIAAQAANTKTTVAQVASSVTVSTDVDYTITGTEPFTTTGSVNITNTEHAVLIISHIKPSKVKSLWLKSHVFINGAQAVDGTNCQVKMYASGTIIMPYAKTIKPLTVYSDKNFGGTAVNDFGLEHSGGFMNTLTDAKLNNKIRSFKLKRGYMVTFSTRASGRGYSRCFIADTEDLEIPEMPIILDNSISSYRVFVWYDAQKKSLANDTNAGNNDKLNVTSCYSFGPGESRLPDQECVPHHIYEGWPSASALGSATYSCHMKTNNEPGNSADDHPQSVAEVLAGWEDLMRTGMRLCSESSHDGSMGHLKAFMDSIDARGWRCDILDLHCYWPTGTFNNINWYISEYGKNRPVWISEWVWGASWNNNGAFAVNDRGNYEGNWAYNYNGTKPIIDQLNSNSRIERYYYWNSEANCSKILLNGQLSTLGQYYADMETGLAYNKKNEYVPLCPPQYAPRNLTADYDAEKQKITLAWFENNGEYNQSMTIQRKTLNEKVFSDIQTVDLKELAGKYTAEVEGVDGYSFRIKIIDANGTAQYSNIVTAQNSELTYGGLVTTKEGEQKYLGGNRLLNGDFSMGLAEWKNGKNENLTAPYYEAVKVGGINNSPYLQCYGTSTAKAEQSICMSLPVKAGECYYIGISSANNSSPQNIGLGRTEGTMSSSLLNVATGSTSSWATQFTTTTIPDLYNYIVFDFRSLKGISQFDEVKVSKLFDTKEEAIADAMEWEKKRAELFMQYYSASTAIVSDLKNIVDAATDPFQIQQAVNDALEALDVLRDAPVMLQDAKTFKATEMDGAEVFDDIITAFSKESTIKEILDAGNKYYDLSSSKLTYNINSTSIKNGTFKGSSDGWTVKAGTYTAGDQRLHDGQAGKTCWNAWWSISVSGNLDKTMAIKQEVASLPSGYYALECKATTQHGCVTDQHAYIMKKGASEVFNSPVIPYGVLDLPTVSNENKWCLLTTPYIYVAPGETVVIGFTGSKQGAKDKTWMSYNSPSNTGDNREGWWCATDFQLRYIPAYVAETDASGWGTFALPLEATAPSYIQTYKIAGMSDDKNVIFLEKEQDNKLVKARPYIYKAEPGKKITIVEQAGTAATSGTVYSNLTPWLRDLASYNYPTNSLVLRDGKFELITSGTKIHCAPSSTYVTSSSAAKLPVIKEGQADYEYIYTKGFSTTEMLLGDANGDGEITLADADMIVKFYLGIPVPDMSLYKSDVDGDGVITMSDANAVVNMIK